jgi:hypothetical protein
MVVMVLANKLHGLIKFSVVSTHQKILRPPSPLLILYRRCAKISTETPPYRSPNLPVLYCNIFP